MTLALQNERERDSPEKGGNDSKARKPAQEKMAKRGGSDKKKR
jgi:hypothetical protein